MTKPLDEPPSNHHTKSMGTTPTAAQVYAASTGACAAFIAATGVTDVDGFDVVEFAEVSPVYDPEAHDTFVDFIFNNFPICE